MNTWHGIMFDIAQDNPEVQFKFCFASDPANPTHDGPMSITVTWPDGSRGSIYQTSGGDWTFGG